MIRKDIIDNLPEWFSHAPIGDFFLEILSMKAGHGLYLPDPMSTYRVFSFGSWSDVMRNDNNGQRMIKFGLDMLKNLEELEHDKAFLTHDFSFKKSCIYTNIAIGQLLRKKNGLYRESIEKSMSYFYGSSTTQRILYFFRTAPRIARLLFVLKRSGYTVLRVK